MQMVTNNATVTLNHVTMLDQAHNTLTLRVMDAAGNEAEVAVSGDVDLIPPGATTLTAVNAINVRQPNVRLSWNAVSGNETRGPGADAYEVRFSRQPIDSDAKFDAACKLDTLLKTGEVPGGADAGDNVSFDVIGPDTRAFNNPCSFAPQTDPSKCDYYFAVRAIDAVGNRGGVTGSMSVNLCMHHFRVRAGTDFSTKTYLWQKSYPVGDVNGDGLADIAIGGYTADMFCIIYGSGSPSDITLSNTGGTGYQCFKGPDITSGEGAFGSPVVGGDIDGDGVNDIAVGSGAGSSNPHKVYVFFGVKDGAISTTPNLVISGFDFGGNGTQLAMDGDFNGDGYKDLMIAAKKENRVYLIPGDKTWKTKSNLAIDLSDTTDLSTYKVTVLSLTDMNVGTYYFFGIFVGYMKDINGDGMDEAVVGQYKNPGAYYVFKGRATTSTQTLSVSAKWDGSEDQDNAVRVLVDTGMTERVSWDNNGMYDLGWDSTPDLMTTDYYQETGKLKRVFIYSGKFLAERFGKDARIDATPEPIPGIFTNDNGTVITGNIENTYIADSFDGLSMPGMMFTNSNINGAQPDGYVYYRSNYAWKDAFGTGTYPISNMAFRNPYDPQSTDFGRGVGSVSHLKVIGDFNGDGFSDIMVGRDRDDYQVILY